MAFPAVRLSIPSPSLFKLPPRNAPQSLWPPLVDSTLLVPPFSIPPSFYYYVLQAKVPITIVCLYVATVVALNTYNASTGNKPWSISKTRSFFYFVIAHNVFLAVYSAWTFIGVFNLLARVLQNPLGPTGVVGLVDSLCKIHGTSGLGNATAYNPELSRWVSVPPSTEGLTSIHSPSTTDVGRLWNEGLGFYGWIFYLSKFYEMIDTAIILAQGKKGSTLQIWHHAGVLMCMWVNIRFMCSPFWIGMLMNTGIHALMYTYYALTAFAIPVPKPFKQSLTALQIIQFFIGTFTAAIHAFISYTIPVEIIDVSNPSSTSTVDVLLYSAEPIQQYRMETVPCIDTSGQMFAIWLNVLYLLPLTVLFIRFFIRSYITRTRRKGVPHATKHRGTGTRSSPLW